MSKSGPIIYLDMDGVCVDFASAGLRANGFDPDQALQLWQGQALGEFHTYKVLGIDRDDYWQAIARQGEDFWVNLEAYPWFSQLYQALTDIGPVFFLSAPTRTPSCLSGKAKWLQRRFGGTFRDFIFTTHKHLLAQSQTILIDDYEMNINRFRQAGGQGVLFPQLWNGNYRHVSQRLDYTIGQVRKLHK